MKNSFFMVILFLCITFFVGCEHMVSPCDTEQFERSIVSASTTDGGINVSYINIENNKQTQSFLKNRDISKNSIVLNFLAKDEYYLINNAANEKTDIIFNAKTLELHKLDYARSSVIGESPNSILHQKEFFYHLSSLKLF